MNFILVFIFLFISLIVHGQKNSSSIVHEIKTVSSHDMTFDDLRFFENILKDKQIVFLGEGTHEDALSIEAKNRVIKYLHQELGFDVLLLEHGFSEMHQLWEDVKTGKDSVTGAFCWISRSLGGASIQEPDQNLAYYIQAHLNTPNELFVGGIDPFENSVYANTFEPKLEVIFSKYIDSFYRKPIYTDFKNFTRKGKMSAIKTRHDYKRRFKKICIDSFKGWAVNLINAIDSILKYKIRTLEDRKELQVAQQCILSRLGELEWNISKKKVRHKSKLRYDAYTKVRDIYMANNLLWYIEHYFPDKKIIVSASSLHLSRNLNTIQTAQQQMGDLVTAGQIVYDKYRDDIYSISFINYNGSGGFYERDTVSIQYSIKTPNSLEYFLHKEAFKYAFLDLQQARKYIPLCKKPYSMHPTFSEPHITNWEKMYDGVFYIDKMKPMKSFFYKNRMDKEQPYFPHPDWYSN